ncbi:hypothetical protein EMCRGX_G005693 [Ephydatia muelleri]
MLVSTDGTAVRQTTQVPQLQQPLVQVELCASSEAVYCHLTSEGATGQTATTDIQVLNHAGPGSGGVFGSSTFDPGPFDTLRLPMVVPKAPSQWQAYAGAVLRAGLRRSSARCLQGKPRAEPWQPPSHPQVTSPFSSPSCPSSSHWRRRHCSVTLGPSRALLANIIQSTLTI